MREAQRDHVGNHHFGTRPDESANDTPLRSTAKGVPKGRSKDPTPPPEGECPPTARDAAILEALTRLRLLSYPQLGRAFFPGRSLEAVGQRVRKLAEAGWVTIFEHRALRGGHPRYVLPTARGQAFGVGAVRSAAEGTPQAGLVELMLPAGPKAPLELAAGAQPPFLAHQRECNHLALTLTLAGPIPVLWASTWDRPFPPRLRDVAMPQPDGVFVLEVAGVPRLVFLEHDRGQESLAHFAAAKVERYAELAARPELCAELLGFSSFAVWVTVLDVRFRRPIRRLRALVGVVQRAGAEDLFSLSLAGWVNDFPGAPVWFAGGAVPEGESVALGAHDPALLSRHPVPRPERDTQFALLP